MIIENHLEEELHFILRDFQGRILREGKSKQKTRVPLDSYPSGAYLMELQSSAGRRVVKLTKN
ncbi:MAG: T9SS type A sorting domain-containing protein [Bacteroidota bacterium]|nr:MAG: T9SS type A sorting domain-containing protein [Bacteroidota bacterium]